MAMNSNKHGNEKLKKVGKLLASRLHEAREKQGVLQCPICHKIFDGTHLIKCPICRTLINKTFQEVPSPEPILEQMELDFFS